MLMVFGNWHLSLPLSFVNPLDLLEHSSSTLSDLHCDEVLGLSENSMLDEYLDHFLFLNCPYNAQVSFNWGIMRAPSLLSQCLPGLVPQDKGSHSSPSISERDVHLPSPAVEIVPSKAIYLYLSFWYCKAPLIIVKNYFSNQTDII